MHKNSNFSAINIAMSEKNCIFASVLKQNKIINIKLYREIYG